MHILPEQFPRSSLPLRLSCLSGLLIASVCTAASDAPASERAAPPSRLAEPGCEWVERVAQLDEKTGLGVWVQRCDPKTNAPRWELTEQGLSGHISAEGPGRTAEPVRYIEIFNLNPGESPVAGIQRIFRAHTTDPTMRRGCVVQPYRGRTPIQPGTYRYTVVPSSRYAQVWASGSYPDNTPPYPCGEWGEQHNHVQYFEVQPASRIRKVIFVRTGTSPVLFDEQSVQFFSPLPNGEF